MTKTQFDKVHDALTTSMFEHMFKQQEKNSNTYEPDMMELYNKYVSKLSKAIFDIGCELLKEDIEFDWEYGEM